MRLNDLLAIDLGIGSMGVMRAALDRTTLAICHGDSRDLGWVESGSVHLALTSPPYWTLKECRVRSGSASHSTRLADFFLPRKAKWSSLVGWLRSPLGGSPTETVVDTDIYRASGSRRSL